MTIVRYGFVGDYNDVSKRGYTLTIMLRSHVDWLYTSSNLFLDDFDMYECFGLLALSIM